MTSAPATTLSLNNSRIFSQVDGIEQGSFIYNASLGSEVTYQYNIMFFAKEGLTDELHNVTMMCGDGNPSLNSICLLDRIIYT